MSGASPARRYQPRPKPTIRPLTPLSRPASTCRQASTERQDRFYRPRVNASGFPDPRRLPSTSAPRPLSRREPATVPQLCRCGPASDALSLLALLSHGGARPSTVVTGYSPVVVRTARRLPTSAIETKCDHNRAIDRAPHTAPKSPSAQLYLRVAIAPFGAQPAEISRLRGRLVAKRGVFPPRSLTAEASPQPDWLGHLLSQP
jgi:hypothetical protein